MGTDFLGPGSRAAPRAARRMAAAAASAK